QHQIPPALPKPFGIGNPQSIAQSMAPAVVAYAADVTHVLSREYAQSTMPKRWNRQHSVAVSIQLPNLSPLRGARVALLLDVRLIVGWRGNRSEGRADCRELRQFRIAHGKELSLALPSAPRLFLDRNLANDSAGEELFARADNIVDAADA